MADYKERILHQLESQIEFLRLAVEDEEVRNRLKELMEEEIEFESLLLGFEGEKGRRSTKEEETFGQRVKQKLGLSWKDWIGKIFEKINSLLSLVIPGFGGSK